MHVDADKKTPIDPEIALEKIENITTFSSDVAPENPAQMENNTGNRDILVETRILI